MKQLDKRTAVLVDPHPLWHEAVEQVLARLGISVAAKLSSADRALAVLARVRPDLFVLELEDEAASGAGIELVRRARELLPALRVVALCERDEAEHVSQALGAGASAYVVKSAHPDDLAAAVRQSFSNSIFLANTTLATPAARALGEGDAPSPARELTKR